MTSRGLITIFLMADSGLTGSHGYSPMVSPVPPPRLSTLMRVSIQTNTSVVPFKAAQPGLCEHHASNGRPVSTLGSQGTRQMICPGSLATLQFRFELEVNRQTSSFSQTKYL